MRRRAQRAAGRRLLLLPTTLALVAGAVVLGRGDPDVGLRVDPPAALARGAGGRAGDAGVSRQLAPTTEATVLPGQPGTGGGGGAPAAGPAATGAAAPGGPVTPSTAAASAAAPLPVAPSTTVARPVAGSADEAQVLQVLDLVFDLELPFPQKAPYIEDGPELAPLYDQFVVIGQQLGELELRARDVVAGPDEAQFSFDALLNGATVRQGIPGTARRVGPAWQLTRASMCQALALAALACPA